MYMYRPVFHDHELKLVENHCNYQPFIPGQAKKREKGPRVYNANLVCLENTIQFIMSIIFVSTLIFVIDHINFGSKTFKATLYCYDKL